MAAQEDIIAAIKQIVDSAAPQVRYVSKYGGEVLALDPGSDSSFVGGIFAYDAHVTLEFSQGARFDDPKGRLEGKGKLRRHLKFETLGDVEAKNTAFFVQQAVS